MVNFVLNIRSVLVWDLHEFRNIFMLECSTPLHPWFVGGFATHQGLHPQTPEIFGLNHPRQLVIEYHWLAFSNLFCKNL